MAYFALVNRPDSGACANVIHTWLTNATQDTVVCLDRYRANVWLMPSVLSESVNPTVSLSSSMPRAGWRLGKLLLSRELPMNVEPT